MSSNESPQLLLSDEQEREVVDWVGREHWRGTVVRAPLINWFAERVLHRDGVGQDHALAPDFAQGFLERHPGLAKTIADIPSPVPEQPLTEPAVPLRGSALLRDMKRKDARRSLYGDSPPPPRQAAPYPEGEIINIRLTHFTVRHGNTVVKYTTSRDGFGAGEHPNEALAMRFIRKHTTIPVPAVISSDWDRITMEYVEGRTLQQEWQFLTSDQRTDILTQLRGYIAQLQALPYADGTQLGRLDGQGAVLPCIMPRLGGLFNTIAEFHAWLVQPRVRLHAQSMFWHQVTAQLGAPSYSMVFTHGDIAARNILVRDGRIVALLDWKFAGWYPVYWEYVFTICGLDNIAWKTLGSQVPSLFSKRYDLEYILMQFIMSFT